MPTPFAVIPAAYVFLTRRTAAGEEVLLQRRANTGYMDGHWVAGAAGHVEPGETARSAAVRETREELGVDVALDDLVPCTVMQRTDGTDDPVEQRVDWFFTATTWRGTPRVVEPAKCAAVGWYPLTGLPEPMPGYERLVLDGLRTGDLAPVTAWGFAPAT